MTTVASTTPTLAYRRPAGEIGAIADSKRKIDAAVHNRERAFQVSAWTMLACGFAALLIGPAVVTALIAKMHFAHALLASSLGFVAAAAVFMPLLFWTERLTRRQWLDDEEEGVIAPVPVAGLLEIILWGPRTIVAAMQRRRQRVHGNVLTDAAAIIAYLRHFAEDGVGTDELPTLRPEPVLSYLASRDWVGISADGRRVWLRADSRRALGFDAR